MNNDSFQIKFYYWLNIRQPLNLDNTWYYLYYLDGSRNSGGVQSIAAPLPAGIPPVAELFFLLSWGAIPSPWHTVFKNDNEAQSTPLYASVLSADFRRSLTCRTWIRASLTVYCSSTTFMTEPSCKPNKKRLNPDLTKVHASIFRMI